MYHFLCNVLNYSIFIIKKSTKEKKSKKGNPRGGDEYQLERTSILWTEKAATQ